MFDFWRQVKLKQARNALREGRLEEAYSIANEKGLRSHRGGQALLEKLARPLIDRAREHLEAGRHREALIDVERALGAGGVQVEASALRDEIIAKRDHRRHDENKIQDLLQSARRHLNTGSLAVSQERLDQIPADREGASSIERQIRNRQERGQRARERSEHHLERGELLEALEEARRVIEELCRNETPRDFLDTLHARILQDLSKQLADGDLLAAAELHRRLRGLTGPSLTLNRHDAIFKTLRLAAESLEDDRHDEALVHLGRLRPMLPQADWIETAIRSLESLMASSRDLRSGPLGLALEATRRNVADCGLHAADGLGALPAELIYDAILSNPPLHTGKDQQYDTVRALCEDAPARLSPKGALWLVTQRPVPIGRWLEDGFAEVEVVDETRSFRVWRGFRPNVRKGGRRRG